MSQDREHYLKRELYELVQKDSHIFEFLEAGSLDGIWYWDLENLTEEWLSPRFKELFGYEDHEVPSTSTWWQEHICPEDLQFTVDNFNKHCADPNHPYDQTVRYRHKDGSTVWVRCRGIAIRDETGKAIRMLGAHTDVTALNLANEKLLKENKIRKRAEDALRSEQELLKRMFAIQERERKLVAYEIHDGIVQYATAALMHMDTYLSGCQQEDASSNIETAAAHMRKIVEEGRRLMNGLRPPVLDERGVVAAIEHLIDEQESTSPQITFEAPTDFERLAPPLEICIYRIVQEAITNARKHSRSEKVRIALSHNDERVHVEIRDWGIGFDGKLQGPGPHGLRGMTERVRLLGGSLGIEGAPGEGTSIQVDLPILVG